jgi:flagellar biosynthesis/type III secretory pathway protein FliH
LSKPSIRRPIFAELAGRPPAPAPEPARTAEPLEAVREGHRIAHAIIARAEVQAQEISAAAREQGLEAGRRVALEQVGGELKQVAVALAAAADHLAEARQRLHDELASTLPAAAVEIAARILGRELSLKPEALVHIVREAIVAVTPAARVDIRLHPADLAVVERHRDLLSEALGTADVRFEPAPSVGRGGCFVETEGLTLTAGVPQLVERALALLKGDEA